MCKVVKEWCMDDLQVHEWFVDAECIGEFKETKKTLQRQAIDLMNEYARILDVVKNDKSIDLSIAKALNKVKTNIKNIELAWFNLERG